MARPRKDLGARKNVRVELRQPGFLIPAPDAPWIECLIVEVSDDGACLDVGALAVPKIFGLAFTAGGEVLRVCALAWRRGELVGARFVSARELRQGFVPTDPPLQQVLPDRSATGAPATGSAGYSSSASPSSLPLERLMK
jgi:hypothetical protein